MGVRPRPAAACFAAVAVAGLLLGGPAHAQTVGLETAGGGTALGLWAARLANHAAMALTVGLLLVPAWLLRAPGTAAASGDDAIRTLAGRASALAAAAGAVWALTTVALFTFGLSNAAARPLPSALDADLAARFLATRFGTAVALQAVAALVVTLLAWLSRRRLPAAVPLVAALAAGVGPAWWGHAGTAEAAVPAIANAWLHIAAACVWVGGLAAVTGLVLRGGGPRTPEAVARYSALAAVGLAAVFATGVVNTVLHVSTPALLLDTTWGRWAVVKTALIVAIGGLGYLHRRRSIPTLRRDPDGGQPLFRRVAAVELLLMVAAFGVASTMSSGMPADAEAASRVQVVRTAIGDGSAEVTLDPARVGRNELHLYVYDADGGLLAVDDASLTLTGPSTELEAALTPTGPGHYTGLGVVLEEPGSHRVLLEVVVDGAPLRASGTIHVR